MQQVPTIADWTGDRELLPLPRRCLRVQDDGGGGDNTEGWEQEEEKEKHILGTSHITLI